MNNFVRSTLKLNKFRPLLNTFKNGIVVSSCFQQRQNARNLWYMCSNSNKMGLELRSNSNLCSCGCGKCNMHTNAEKELMEFLVEEIVQERRAQKSETIPTEVDDFKAKLNGSEIILSKKTDKETISIRFNVNHTVDTPVNVEENEIGELKSQPAFKVDMLRGDTTLSLMCSFTGQEEEANDDGFTIDEISIYNGDWNENVYAVSGEVIDSYLYDLLMNYLEEKGISNKFVKKLSDYSTKYEHSAYISLLEGLSKFITPK